MTVKARQRLVRPVDREFKCPNKLAALGDRRGLTRDTLSMRLGCGYGALRNYLRPLDHPEFRVPPVTIMESIYKWSDGLITPSAFYPTERWASALKADQLEAAE